MAPRLLVLLHKKSSACFVFLASLAISSSWDPIGLGHNISDRLMFFFIICNWSRCFLPSRCCLKADTSMHYMLHNPHHCLLLEVSPHVSLLMSSLWISTLRFFPLKCRLSKSSVMHGTLHSSHHWI